MSNELKPCPFCGHEPKVEREYRYDPGRDESGEFVWVKSSEFDEFVHCSNNDCFIGTSYDGTIPSATIEEWDTRPIEDDLNENLEILDEKYRDLWS